MDEKIHVLIVEDDFRIAGIHRQFVEKMDGFVAAKVVKTGAEALAYLQHCDNRPNLILLDIYIPDVEGLDLLWQIRETYHEIDIIVVSAAKETETLGQHYAGAFSIM
ncbi:response regulator [Virgibacillus sp. FSP13]